MSETCPLGNLEIEGQVIPALELPAVCAICLGGTAARLGLRRPAEELGVRLTVRGRRVVQKGLEGKYYETPGKSKLSTLLCQDGQRPSSLAETEFDSPVIEHRKLKVRSEKSLQEAWKAEFGSRKYPYDLIFPTLEQYSGKPFLVEELIAKLIEDLVESPAKESRLPVAAIAIDEMERLFGIIIDNAAETMILKDIWKEVLRDPESDVTMVIKQINKERKRLPRRAKKMLPLPPNVIKISDFKRKKARRKN